MLTEAVVPVDLPKAVWVPYKQDGRGGGKGENAVMVILSLSFSIFHFAFINMVPGLDFQ